MLSVLRRTTVGAVTPCCVRVSGRSLARGQQQSLRQIIGKGGGRRSDPLPDPTPSLPGRAPIARPLIFTGAVAGTCFVGASVWQYEDMRAKMSKRISQGPLFGLQQRQYKAWSVRQHVNTWWNGLSEGQKVFMPILGLNLAVFVAWRIPRLHNVMMKYFSADPTSRAVCWPMLFSTFSHYSPLHLAANMYVLHSFATGAVASLGKEQFLGLYLGAGVASSLTSHLYKVALKAPGRSLGASGAIMAILGYVCTMHPDVRLSIVFIPELNFTAENGIKALVAFDTLGLLLRWKFFDHAAHLGGALSGIAWAVWGHMLWMKREPIVSWWHELRGSVTK